MQIHKVNLDAIKEEAEKVKRESKSGSFGDLVYFKFSKGDNLVRIFPPYNMKGLIGKRRIQHFSCPPDNDVLFCLKSWEDDFDSCPVCDEIERLYEKYPGVIDLGRQQSVSSYVVNLIDVNEIDRGVQIGTFNPSLYNWVLQQILDAQIGDITDPEKGLNLKVSKEVKKGKGGKEYTRYNKTLMPDRCPIHEDQEIVDMLIESMIDLDQVYSAPDEELLAELESKARLFGKYYDRKLGKDTSGSSVREDLKRKIQERNKKKTETTSDKVKEEKKEEVKDTVVPSDASGKGETYPSCYAGLDTPDEHEDGSYGPSLDLEKCLFCDHMVSCESEAKDKGLIS